MKMQQLHTVAKIIAGQSPPSSTYNSTGDGLPFFQGKTDFQGKYPRVRMWCNSARAKEAKPGDILISVRAPVGSVNICAQKSIIGRGLSAIRTNSTLNAEFLYYFLKSNEQSIAKLGTGSTFKAITQDTLKKVEVPLPSLDDQIRIAHLLGKVEGLIAQRKQHLQQLDELLKSVFLEMFGDPVRNEKEWGIQYCKKAVLNISSGTSYGGEDRAFVNTEEVGVLKISAVTKGTFDPTEFKVVNPTQITKTLRFVKRGDFLFSRANTIELVAACCVVRQDYTQLFLPDKLWALTLNQELINAQFFNYLLKIERYRNVVRNLASGGHDSMLNISMKKFMTLNIPCPPVDIQTQFAAIVEKVESIKSRYQQSLTDLE